MEMGGKVAMILQFPKFAVLTTWGNSSTRIVLESGGSDIF